MDDMIDDDIKTIKDVISWHETTAKLQKKMGEQLKEGNYPSWDEWLDSANCHLKCAEVLKGYNNK